MSNLATDLARQLAPDGDRFNVDPAASVQETAAMAGRCCFNSVIEWQAQEELLDVRFWG